MNTLELLDKKEQLKQRAEEIVSKAEKETRRLNEGEHAEFNSIADELKDIDNEIRKIASETKLTNTNNTSMKKEKFSLLKAINDVANSRQLDERAQEVVSAGIAEFRKSGQNYSGQIVLPIEERTEVQATVEGAGQETVAEDKLALLEPLRANLVMVKAGASYLSGLVGNVSIPAYSGSNVSWAGEVSAATDGAGDFSEVNLEPKRLTAYVDVSKQFLIQDSASAEEMLKRDIVNAISDKLEATILGSAAGSATMPAGIFNGVTPETKDITYKRLVDMETALEEANVAGNKCFIVSPSAKGILKTTAKDALYNVTDGGVHTCVGCAGCLMEENEVNGYPVYCTSNVTSKGVVMGHFEDFVIGQWGGIDLTVDPYTQAANGKVRLVINAYFDAKPRRTGSFQKAILK